MSRNNTWSRYACVIPLFATMMVMTTMPATAASIAGVWWNKTASKVLKTEDGSAIPLASSTKRLVPESFAGNKVPNAADIKDRCSPIGVPRVWLQPTPFQIIEQPGVIAIVYENRQSFRLIYLNESTPDPQTLDPWFFGHSVGHWEADTLVVESLGFNADTRLDEVLPHSDELKVTERFRKIDGGRKLEVRVTIDDAKTFTKPWTARLVFANAPNEHIAEYVCGMGVITMRKVGK